jgi:hypothetical protein
MNTNHDQDLDRGGDIIIRPEDFDTLDFALFDPIGIEVPADLRLPDQVLKLLDGGHSQPAAIVREAVPQLTLFDDQPPVHEPMYDLPPATVRRLWPIVSRAYADVRNGRSVDFCVAEPDANLLFLQRCWVLGAAASPFELNWVLLNARKANRLSLPRSSRVSIPKDRLDRFSFAADMAMRYLQDRIYREEQRDVSIDRVFCDPRLAQEFDRLAAHLAPGFQPFEYRWAVISLRKARRSGVQSASTPIFTEYGRVEDVRISKLPTTSGIYWITSGRNSLFAGAASSLRLQVDSLVDQLGTSVLPNWMPDQPIERPVLRVLECSPIQSKQAHATLLRNSGSLLNFRFGDQSGTDGSVRRPAA